MVREDKKVLTGKKLFLKLFRKIIPLSGLFIFASTVFRLNTRTYGLVLYYEGKEIATVENEETIEKASHMMKQIDSSYESSGEIIQNIAAPKYELKAIDQPVCGSASEIKNKIISEAKSEVVNAIGIYSDGKLVSAASDINEVETLLDSLLDDAKLGDDNAVVKFVENIELVSGLYSVNEVTTVDNLKNIILEGITSQIEYEVKDGDTLESIAMDFDVSAESVAILNNLKNNEVAVGDKLLIEIVDFPIHIETQKLEEKHIDIPFETIRENDDTQYEGWQHNDVEGKNGIQVSLNQVTYINKRLVAQKEISSEIISKPVNEHIYFGTKKREVLPPKSEISEKQSGKFIWPVPYTHNITSKFGDVDGAFRSKPHTGIDISSSGIHGQDIVAASDGVVGVAGSGSGYGNFVKISHNNETSTLYAHCEYLYVKSGQKVSAGQKIASVGMTGNSTGYHTHFEVIVKGKRQNPLNYF